MKKRIPITRIVKITVLILLVLGVWLYAKPLTLVWDIMQGQGSGQVFGNARTVITDMKTMGKLKVLKRFVSGFLELPANTPENAEERKHFRVVHQWEGSAEFTIDLGSVVRESMVEDDCVILRMPKIEIENVRDLPIEGVRCDIKDSDWGYGKKADEIFASMPQLVDKQIRRDVNTKENYEMAKKQAECLLSAMVQATRPDLRVEFVWDN